MQSRKAQSLEWRGRLHEHWRHRNMDNGWGSAGKRPAAGVLNRIKRRLARYLEDSGPGDEPFTPTDSIALRHCLEPGDVLLVEGNSRISATIKYLTQSTWSHAALYV